MDDKNKKTLKTFGKAVLMLVLVGCAITTGAAVWNAAAVGAASGFYVVTSIANFVAEGVGLFFLGKKLFKEQ